MELKFKVYGALCSPEIFKINGIDADVDDFGTLDDRSPETAEPWACGDMQFERIEATKKVLKKYSINKKEYEEVCDKLGELSFGCCGWCV